MEKSRIALSTAGTLDRFIKERQEEFKYTSGELSQLLRDVALASKIVNREVNKAGLIDIMGATENQNVQGENQQKLDVLANIRFIRALKRGGEVVAVISEEDTQIVDFKNNAKYIIAIDPLDGSSNIDVNISIGTIFSIYRRISKIGTPLVLEDVLQLGRQQVAAGYILYGSSTMLVYTTGFGVNGFTYDPSLGEYFLSHPNIKTPPQGCIYSINEGLSSHFYPNTLKYLDFCKKNNYMSRYVGSLVADFHRNLLKGGIYLYPANKTAVNGKLRLLYECNALAFIIEQAGGMATDGENLILDLPPKNIHQRTPFIVGSTDMVKDFTNII